MNQETRTIPYPEGVTLKITAFKASGKYYTTGEAVVYSEPFQDEFLQELADSQTAVGRLHYEDEDSDDVSMYYVIEMTEESDRKYPKAFFHSLLKDKVFKGIQPVPMLHTRLKRLDELKKKDGLNPDEFLLALVELHRYLSSTYKNEKLKKDEANALQRMYHYTLSKATMNHSAEINFLRFV